MTNETERSRPWARALGALLFAVVSLSGCAAKQSLPDLVWPDPPDKPRIKYLGSLQSKDDVSGPSIREVLVGRDKEEAIYQPMGLALSADDKRLYVADRVWNCVFVFDFASGKFSKIGTQERYPLTWPVGVALDPDENVYVADTGTQTIRVYTRAGEFLRSIGKDILVRPTGVAVDGQRGRLYVSDTGGRETPDAHRIRVFTLAGQPLSEVGKRGDRDGEFNFPTFLTLDDAGQLYVVDSVNNRIEVFDSDGKFLWKFGQAGDQVGSFARPKSVAVDRFGNIYVVDSRWSNVQIFNQQGQLLMAFAGAGSDPGLLTSPTGIAIGKNNTIYVSDTFGKRVSVYQLINTEAGDSRPEASGAAQ